MFKWENKLEDWIVNTENEINLRGSPEGRQHNIFNLPHCISNQWRNYPAGFWVFIRDYPVQFYHQISSFRSVKSKVSLCSTGFKEKKNLPPNDTIKQGLKHLRCDIIAIYWVTVVMYCKQCCSMLCKCKSWACHGEIIRDGVSDC